MIRDISARSKYNKYLVENNSVLYQHIDKYAEKCYTDDLIKLITPLTQLQQLEQEYVRKRELNINFLGYKYPCIQNTTTDFTVNNKRVQEKVAGLCIDRGKDALLVHLASNNGKKDNGARKFRTYRLGENDYYWIHSSIDDRFWIIPENTLYERGYISKADETQNKKVICIRYSTEWIKEYQYDYNNINKDKIENLFK